jgi:hypothetical protein
MYGRNYISKTVIHPRLDAVQSEHRSVNSERSFPSDVPIGCSVPKKVQESTEVFACHSNKLYIMASKHIRG